MDTSEKLQQLHAVGLTQSALAALVGVSQATISRVLRGEQVPMEGLVRRVDELYAERLDKPSQPCKAA